MSEARDRAIAQMTSAISTGTMGATVVIDGVSIGAIKKSLDQQEALGFAGGAYAAEGLLVEGFRLTVDVTTLVNTPVLGGELELDGFDYDVKAISKSDNMWRITLLRYLT